MVAFIVPVVIVAIAIAAARALHARADFIPAAAFPITIAMQLGTEQWARVGLERIPPVPASVETEQTKICSSDGTDLEPLARIRISFSGHAANPHPASSVSRYRRCFRILSGFDLRQNRRACAGHNDRAFRFQLRLGNRRRSVRRDFVVESRFVVWHCRYLERGSVGKVGIHEVFLGCVSVIFWRS